MATTSNQVALVLTRATQGREGVLSGREALNRAQMASNGGYSDSVWVAGGVCTLPTSAELEKVFRAIPFDHGTAFLIALNETTHDVGRALYMSQTHKQVREYKMNGTTPLETGNVFNALESYISNLPDVADDANHKKAMTEFYNKCHTAHSPFEIAEYLAMCGDEGKKLYCEHVIDRLSGPAYRSGVIVGTRLTTVPCFYVA